MARNIFTVNATQVVTSQANPQGIKSVVDGYPKDFDSIRYNNDIELTRKKANAEYHTRLGIMYDDTNENRVMKTVTLQNAMGDLLLHECVGGFPAEPEPEEEPEEPGDGE